MASQSNRIILILLLALVVQFAASTTTFVGSYSGVLVYNESVGTFSFNISQYGLVNGYGSIGGSSGNFSGQLTKTTITGSMTLTGADVNKKVVCTLDNTGTLAPTFLGRVSCPLTNVTTEVANGYGICSSGDCSSSASLHGTYTGKGESDRGFASFTVKYLPIGISSGSITNNGVSLILSDESAGIVSTHPLNTSITVPIAFITSIDFPKIEKCTASGTSVFFPSFSGGMGCYLECNNTVCSSRVIIIGYASCVSGPCYPKPIIYNGSANNSSTVCNEFWNCTYWGPCDINGSQERTCSDLNNCSTTKYRPSTKQDCGPCVGVSCLIGQQCQNGDCINQTLNESKNSTSGFVNNATNVTTLNVTTVENKTAKQYLLTGFINWVLGLFGSKK